MRHSLDSWFDLLLFVLQGLVVNVPNEVREGDEMVWMVGLTLHYLFYRVLYSLM